MESDSGHTKQQAQTGIPSHEGSTLSDLESPSLRISNSRSDSMSDPLLPVSSNSSYSSLSTSSNRTQGEQKGDAGMKQGDSLKLQIQKEMIYSAWPDKSKQFVPIDKLHDFTDSRIVQQELNAVDCGTENKLGIQHDYATLSDTIGVSRGKLFVILAMLDELPTILALIDEDIKDSDLPFFLETGNNKGINEERHLCRYVGDEPMRIMSFEDHHGEWSAAKRSLFHGYFQWQVLSPCFNFSSNIDHKNLEHGDIILPFIEESKPENIFGGSCVVRKVKIHIAHQKHHLAHNLDGVNPFYALKSLKPEREEKFCKDEIRNLQRFVDQEQDRLVRLLCTFRHKERFHLMFPWADANLMDFWTKEYPHIENPVRDTSLAQWVSKVILGLAEGLQMIHGPEDSKSTEPVFGRHGDLKPENILWFKGPGCDDLGFPTGVLQICDFGSADFHHKGTVELPAKDILSYTQTYSAPECYTLKLNERISPSFDIWSLGCVLLQFVTWYMLGSKGLLEFEDKRIEECPKGMSWNKGYDIFFKVENDSVWSGWLGPRVAKSETVTEHIRALRANDKMCSPFLLDMLNIIERSLLRIQPANRLDCHGIVKELKEIHNKCQDPEYCTTARYEKKDVGFGRPSFQAFIECCWRVMRWGWGSRRLD